MTKLGKNNYETYILQVRIYKQILQLNGKKDILQGFPGGPMITSSSCNAADTSSIPGPGRSHMPQSNKAHGWQLQKPICL